MYKALLATSSEHTRKFFSQLKVLGDNPLCSITTVCETGSEALKKLSEEKYMIIIIDIELLDMSGIQLLRSVKKDRRCTYAVLYSRQPDFEYARQGIIFGAFDYLTGTPDRTHIKKMFIRIQNKNILSESKIHMRS